MPEDRILFLNLIASPSGVADFAKRFPKLRVVTAFIDQGLDDKKCVSPCVYFSVSFHSPKPIDISFLALVISGIVIIPYEARWQLTILPFMRRVHLSLPQKIRVQMNRFFVRIMIY